MWHWWLSLVGSGKCRGKQQVQRERDRSRNGSSWTLWFVWGTAEAALLPQNVCQHHLLGTKSLSVFYWQIFSGWPGLKAKNKPKNPHLGPTKSQKRPDSRKCQDQGFHSLHCTCPAPLYVPSSNQTQMSKMRPFMLPEKDTVLSTAGRAGVFARVWPNPKDMMCGPWIQSVLGIRASIQGSIEVSLFIARGRGEGRDNLLMQIVLLYHTVGLGIWITSVGRHKAEMNKSSRMTTHP